MLFRLVRPVQRQGSRNRHYVRRIPADVIERAVGTRLNIPVGDITVPVTISAKMDSIRVSLRTNDPGEVKVRQAAVDAYLENVWKGLRADQPVSLTHRQVTALAGKFYRSWANEDDSRTISIQYMPDGANPIITRGSSGELQEERKALWQAIEERTADGWRPLDKEGERAKDPVGVEVLEGPLGAIIDSFLLAEGIGRVDQASRLLLLEAFWMALRDAFASRARNAEGDYAADPKSERFPAWSPPEHLEQKPVRPAPLASSKASMKGLVAAWWTEALAAGRKPSTLQSYQNTMTKFVAFLGHDDAARVTSDDVVRFKDHRLAAGISPKTVKDSDLAGLKTVFGWAMNNRKLATNPAAGITVVKPGRTPRLRSKGFTDEEAVALLRHAADYEPKGEHPKLAKAKKWVPWLCAHTGARVGEMLQLRKEDIRREGEHWVLLITPEAGTVKTNQAREVVLHRQLVERGFPEFVATASPEHLFLTPRAKDGDILAPLKTARNKLRDFVREVVTDKKVQPNHGWRHRFRTLARQLEIARDVRDAIQGWAPVTVGDRYGDFTITTCANAIAKFPRYEVG